MPRKPTLFARRVKGELIALIQHLPAETAVPTARALGTQFDLHASTMFRMLRDLAAEGIVWQSPGGRFFPAADRERNLKGIPVCFIGRELWQWSRLYQEILEGISEVCAANGSPLVLLSAPSLIRQSHPTGPLTFASPRTQSRELASLLRSTPRGCAGFILDNLWSNSALATQAFPGGDRVQLLHGTGRFASVCAPDYARGARLVCEYLLAHKFDEILQIIPFSGDPAIEAATQALAASITSLPSRQIPFAQTSTEISKILRSRRPRRVALICPEDNTAQAIADAIPRSPKSAAAIHVIATQGTGLLSSPFTRLRHDFRRLGRSAASFILHGTKLSPPRIQLIH